ncbi:MAG: type II toxin-antitoxin system RelE/ParE family toxin [Prevotella sp.]|nr:type II toxin-antitoxin system RelE/ParE family toxin [Prevotella sp.]MBR5061107.1 type II toxin-antitoxin system RelE/ParE family toxin [Prevotella sp.]
MSYTIKTIAPFDKDFKRLRKRYRSLEADVLRLVAELQENPLMGADLGHGVHKVRLAIQSKGGGKRGGARVITYADVVLQLQEGTIYLLAMYDKTDQETISNKAIKALLNEIQQ